MIDITEIHFDRRFDPPDEEIIKKLILSRQEYEAQDKRALNCPICGFRLIGASADRHGLIEIKCRKCKFEGPVNLAYFRTQRYTCRHICWRNTGRKKQIR